ncbi:MAG TPA: hypothetical protein VD837_07880 [Terriglobales bacterium]|nr:hypothetical protein [Terriglobales bacterium]
MPPGVVQSVKIAGEEAASGIEDGELCIAERPARGVLYEWLHAIARVPMSLDPINLADLATGP